MVEITIANVHDLPPPNEWEPWMVYVGHGVNAYGFKRSPLANPYKIGQIVPRGCGWNTVALTSKTAIQEFRKYLAEQIASEAVIEYVPGRRPPVTIPEELRRLRALLATHGKLVLVCDCGPKASHAIVIRDVLLEDARC